MDIFLTLFTNLLPLYGLIMLGFIAGRWLEVESKSLANVAVFICNPIVVFGFVVQLDFKMAYVALPIIFFLISALMAFAFLEVGRRVYGDARANLLAICASGLNTGYFGLPLMLVLFDPQWVAVYLFMILGGMVCEGTVNYYIVARGHFDTRQSLIKFAKFPFLYAMVAAILCNWGGVQMPDLFNTYWGYFKGAYVVLGMMIIGASLAKTKKLVWAPKFFTLTFLAQFIIWPVLAFVLITLDQNYTHLFEAEVHRFVMIMSLVPPAANVAAFAAQFHIRPEKAATTVLLGTIFALGYIPAMMVLLGLY